ncbi:MAG: hypothetical protein ACPLTR_00850 [Thermacetogeniaceae bacterium]
MAFLVSAALVAGGVTVAAHRLQDLRGERVELRLLPEPLLEFVERASGVMKGDAVFSLAKDAVGAFKRFLVTMQRLVSERKASLYELFLRLWNYLRYTFTKGALSDNI